MSTPHHVELNLQFTDRVHQQLNELSKMAISINSILRPGEDKMHRKKNRQAKQGFGVPV
ncbi:hypothetical protein [uncultured Desulfobacter sp.]|uniref:hypothetical protein n=1 Tax=uncultured Desulfobacter sp. TaxID=240139 RepID=UPI0029F5B56A|nr:hypothetical protein [uncultured Desulfobacter sp.]